MKFINCYLPLSTHTVPLLRNTNNVMLAARSPASGTLLLSLLSRRRFASLAIRSFSPSANSSNRNNKNSQNRSRGGLPRFHSQTLPPSKGEVVRVQGDEFWHMTKVLRLALNHKVELFDGAGGLIEGCIQRLDRTGADVMALEDPKVTTPQGTQWHVFAAFGALKGGRADWLIEKCTELGASSVTPLLTLRSPIIGDNRVDRLQRVILAAVKQCQRLHGMTLNPPIKFHNFLTIVDQSKFSLLAAAEATPLVNVLLSSSIAGDGIVIVGPEGGLSLSVRPNVDDFTEEEVELMTKAGATLVGLGPSRLRVETATIALLSTVMLWSDARKLDP